MCSRLNVFANCYLATALLLSLTFCILNSIAMRMKSTPGLDVRAAANALVAVSAVGLVNGAVASAIFADVASSWRMRIGALMFFVVLFGALRIAG